MDEKSPPLEEKNMTDRETGDNLYLKKKERGRKECVSSRKNQ